MKKGEVTGMISKPTSKGIRRQKTISVFANIAAKNVEMQALARVQQQAGDYVLSANVVKYNQASQEQMLDRVIHAYLPKAGEGGKNYIEEIQVAVSEGTISNQTQIELNGKPVSKDDYNEALRAMLIKKFKEAFNKATGEQFGEESITEAEIQKTLQRLKRPEKVKTPVPAERETNKKSQMDQSPVADSSVQTESTYGKANAVETPVVPSAGKRDAETTADLSAENIEPVDDPAARKKPIAAPRGNLPNANASIGVGVGDGLDASVAVDPNQETGAIIKGRYAALSNLDTSFSLRVYHFFKSINDNSQEPCNIQQTFQGDEFEFLARFIRKGNDSYNGVTDFTDPLRLLFPEHLTFADIKVNHGYCLGNYKRQFSGDPTNLSFHSDEISELMAAAKAYLVTELDIDIDLKRNFKQAGTLVPLNGDILLNYLKGIDGILQQGKSISLTQNGLSKIKLNSSNIGNYIATAEAMAKRNANYTLADLSAVSPSKTLGVSNQGLLTSNPTKALSVGDAPVDKGASKGEVVEDADAQPVVQSVVDSEVPVTSGRGNDAPSGVGPKVEVDASREDAAPVPSDRKRNQGGVDIAGDDPTPKLG